jgi:hypothetical protein
MFPVDVINALKAVINRDEPLVTAVPAVKPIPSGLFGVGLKYQGIVQARTTTGLVKVRVEGQLLEMRLPQKVQAGDAVELQTVSVSPQLTFKVVTALPTSQLTPPPVTHDQPASEASLIEWLSRPSPEGKTDRPVQGSITWPPLGPSQTEQLANELRTVLSQSGLFYESHQSQWVAGRLGTEALMAEPQNRLQSHEEHHQPPSDNIPVPEPLRPIIRQQLDVLETGLIAWQGSVWPDQTLHWEIWQEQHDASPAGHERPLATRLSLDLPRLGKVVALILLGGQGIKMTIQAESEASRSLLQQALPGLENALTTRALRPLDLQVKRDERAAGQ